jgi:hypothetical protein
MSPVTDCPSSARTRIVRPNKRPHKDPLNDEISDLTRLSSSETSRENVTVAYR